VKILAVDQRPFPGDPIPLQGFDSLDGEAPHSDSNPWTPPNYSAGDVNQPGGLQIGQTPVVGTLGGISGATALSNMQNNYWGGYYSADVGDFLDQDVPGHAGGLIGIDIWGHWGLLGGAGGVSESGANTGLGSPMTGPPKPDLRPHGILNGHYWAIWELCGVPRPPLQDPHKPYDQLKNPYVPSPAAAKAVAKAFEKKWNDAADAMNQSLFHAPFLSGEFLPASSAPFSPPQWDFEQPFEDAYSGLNHAWSFNGPINASVQHFPAVTITFPMAPQIGVAQLDPKKWDTSLFPPVLRSVDWSKTIFGQKPTEQVWIQFFALLQSGGGSFGGG
jgi:hypothetical protein